MIKRKSHQSLFCQTLFDEYEAPCVHGFFNRGNLSDPGVAECVNSAMVHLITFLGNNVVQWSQ